MRDLARKLRKIGSGTAQNMIRGLKSNMDPAQKGGLMNILAQNNMTSNAMRGMAGGVVGLVRKYRKWKGK